jgi:hemerythrin-like domain-containing protein
MQSQGPRGAIAVILHEHQQVSTVVEGMLRFMGLRAGGTPTWGLMVSRAMLYYILEYPQQEHHPKEDRYLLTPLRDRTDEF